MFKPDRFPRVLRNFIVGYLFLHLIAAAVLVGVLTNFVRHQMIINTTDQMNAMAIMLNEHIRQLEDGIRDQRLPQHIETLGQKTKFRFTVVDKDGEVIADSETGTIDIGYHGDRPEIMASQLGTPGFSSRFSATLKKTMLFLALTHQAREGLDSGFVRVATPQASINATIQSLQTYVFLFAVSLSALVALLTFLFSTHLLRPLGHFSEVAKKIGVGQYDPLPPLLARNDEWGSLAEAFRQMQSELSHRERRIVKTRDRLEAVLSSMIEGVVAIDARKKVIIANRAACRMFALSAEDVIDRDFLDLVRNPELTTAVEKTQATEKFSKTEFETLVNSSRRTISARVSVLPAESHSEDGQQGIVAVLHDVTELRQLENMRRDFVANVSHELKTPLTSIKACAETLRMGAIHDDQKNIFFLDQIESNAEQLDQQIQDILQLARVESGKESWEIEALAVNDICHQCVLQFASEAEQRKVSLKYVANPDLPVAQADYEGVVTILKNLISNAIHYTPNGGQVEVRAEVIDDEIVIKVSDSGIGISKEHHARIFERFYRVDRARSREAGGTGLGLAIVKHLANAFGGVAQVESQLGKGSTFTVRLPAG